MTAIPTSMYLNQPTQNFNKDKNCCQIITNILSILVKFARAKFSGRLSETGCTLGYMRANKKCSVYGALHTSKLFHCCVRWNGPIIVKKVKGGNINSTPCINCMCSQKWTFGSEKNSWKRKKTWDCNKTRKCHKTRTLYVCVSTLWGQILEKFVFECTRIDFWN